MTMATASRRRYPELDVIRLFSLSLIIAIHFFMYNSFYYDEPTWAGYYLALMVRTYLCITIPMFMMLTGFLLCEKKPRTGWWHGLDKTLLIYLITCVPCLLVRRAVEPGYQPSAAMTFWSFLDFEVNPYGWYIDLYIGLFLLSPFLNVMHQGLDQKWHRTLLIILFVLISLPTLTNYFHWFSPDFWRHPADTEKFNLLLPDYWVQLPYALMYYEMGAYVKRYPPKARARTLLLLLVCALLLFTAYNAWRQDGRTFSEYPWIGYNGFEAAVLTPLTFCFLARAFAPRIKKEKTIRLLGWLSDLCLGAYLLSYCADMLIYQVLGFAYRFSSFQQAFPWFPVLVPAGTVLSLFFSIFVTWPVRQLLRIIRRLKPGGDQRMA